MIEGGLHPRVLLITCYISLRVIGGGLHPRVLLITCYISLRVIGGGLHPRVLLITCYISLRVIGGGLHLKSLANYLLYLFTCDWRMAPPQCLANYLLYLFTCDWRVTPPQSLVNYLLYNNCCGLVTGAVERHRMYLLLSYCTHVVTCPQYLIIACRGSYYIYTPYRFQHPYLNHLLATHDVAYVFTKSNVIPKPWQLCWDLANIISSNQMYTTMETNKFHECYQLIYIFTFFPSLCQVTFMVYRLMRLAEVSEQYSVCVGKTCKCLWHSTQGSCSGQRPTTQLLSCNVWPLSRPSNTWEST